MPKGEPSRLENLEALLAERRKHEGYLAKLEERRDGTPDSVFSKLRDEYLTKLTDAQVRAAMEADALATGLSDDESAVADAQEKLAVLEAEKLEGELRAAVGEFDPKEWNKKLTALKANIMMAERDRDARLEVFERARALIDEAKSGLSENSAPAAPAPQSPPSAAKTRPTAAMTSGPSFDELAFLNSVVPRTSVPGAPAPRASKPVGQVVEPAADGAKDREPAKPKATPAASAAPVAAPAPAPAVAAEAQAEKPAPAAEAEPKSGPSATPVPDDETNAFGKPTPRTSQAVKTLKCQECGTFNFPTEWYCERCGGELAAL